MNCPVCHAALVVVERESIEVDWCLGCRGLWFDEGELELLAEKSGRRFGPADLQRNLQHVGTGSRRCPRCRKKMELVALESEPSMQIDRCAAHGIWLDRGELGRIVGEAGVIGSAEGVVMRFLGETFCSADEAPDRRSS